MKAILLAFSCFAVLALPSKANIVTNPGFETGDFSGWASGGDLTFVVVGTFTPRSGSYHGLFGPFNASAILSQDLATIPNAVYDFSFWLLNEGGGPNTFTVSWNGIQIGALTDEPAFQNPGTNSLEYREFTFPSLTATGHTTTILFSFQHFAAFWDLDDVSVNQVVVPNEEVPEPSAFSLACLGAVGLAFVRRRL